MEPQLSYETELNFIERLIHHEVEVIMTEENVTDRRGLYNKITKSLWRGEISLQTVYERQIAKSKTDKVWNAIQQNAVISNIQEYRAELMNRVSVLFGKHQIANSGDLYEQIVDSIMLGERARSVLEEELSQEELEEIKPEFEELVSKGKYQLPSHIKLSALVSPSLQTSLDANMPAISKRHIAPPTPMPTLIVREKPPSTEWIQVFQRHSVLWKFFNPDFSKIEEWAVFGFSTKQIARAIVDECKDISSFNKRLYSAFFFLAKRQLNLSSFVDALAECFSDFGVESEQYSLRMFVNLLLSNCDKLVRQKLMHLIGASNPIPFTEFIVAESQTTFTQHFTPELFWILDDKFLFFSYGIGNCKGKSSLLNRIFGTDFETSKDSQFFRGTVDYQSDSCTVPHRGVVVADGHGIISHPVKLGIFTFADGIIVHVPNEIWNSNPEIIRKEIDEAIQVGVKLFVVLVRDVIELRSGRILESFNLQDTSALGEFEGAKPLIWIFKLPAMMSDDMVDYYVKAMREKIMECLWSTFGLSAPSLFQYSPGKARFECKKDKREMYCTLLSTTQKSTIAAARSVLNPFLSLIDRTMHANQIHESSFLPVYPKFKAMHQLRNSLVTSRFGSTDTHMRRVLLLELAEEIKQTDIEHLPEAIMMFETMISVRHNSLMVMEFIELLKKLVDKEVPHTVEGEEHPAQYLAEGKAICIELFWREINQLYLLGSSTEKVSQAYRSFMQAGEPFELVDGDNMYFPFQFLYYTLKNIAYGKSVLVVGAVGPQNSGKSTLLNFMFGCTLAQSKARTTKGIYGTLMDCPIEGYDLLLVLDPEGLHSTSTDPTYDRKIVLFMLAICDVVIVTVRDPINDLMSKTLEVCTRSLASLHNTKVPQPIIFFVQSQQPNQYIPQQALIDVIANLTQQGLSDALNLNAENFIALPSAFHSKDIPITGSDRWKKFSTLPKYVEKVSSFTDTMFAKVKLRQSDFAARGIIKPFHDLPSWIQFAHSTFISICKFDDLTRFGDLLEEKQDQFVRKWLQIVIDNVVANEKKENIFALQDCITGIETYFNVAITATQQELMDMMEKNNIKSTLHKTHLETLKVIMEHSRANWVVDAIIRIANERLQNKITNGHFLINEKIRDILREGRKYTREQLNMIFDECFQESYNELTKRSLGVQASINTLCMSIINIYKLYCQDLPNSEDTFSEIDIEQDPDAKKAQLLEQLKTTNYEDMTYMLPGNLIDAIDPRLISGMGWVFVNATSLAQMKEGVIDYLVDHSSNVDIADHIISNVFAKKPFSERMRVTMTKWFTTAKCAIPSRPFPNNLGPSKLVLLLVRAVKKELRHSPQLIARLVNIPLPFEMVRNRAQEVKLQDHHPFTEVIHRCVSYVNDTIIAPLETDLRAFGIALTKSMRSNLHLLMLQYLVHLNLRFYSKLLENPNASTLRESWKATFLEQTLHGPARDIASIEAVMAKFEESFQPYCLETARNIFDTTLKKFEQNATRYQLQLEFERNLTTKSKDELLHYIADPVTTLVQHFEDQWNLEEDSMLKRAQHIYVTKGNSLQALEHWTAEVYHQIESAKFTAANDIFMVPNGMSAVQALLYKEKAVVLLYCDMLRGRIRNARYAVEGMELDVVDWNVASSSDSVKNIENLDLLIKFVMMAGTISDLLMFAQRLAARMNNFGNSMRKHLCTTTQLDPAKRLKLVRSRAMGCDQLCPCCKRCCDEEHWRMHNMVGTGPNRHKCRLGHQYRGMVGFAFEKTKFASLQVCNNLQDNDRVWFSDRYISWHDFKEKFPSWDFHFPAHVEKGLDSARNRMAFIWQQIGQDLCNEYNIQFTAQDQSYAERTKHFIFLVGATSSTFENWQVFLRALKKFADTKLARDPSVIHLASLVIFSQRAQIMFRELALSTDIFESDSIVQLPFWGDKTSFSAALEVVCQMLEKQVSRIPAVIVLVSDGNDSFPQKELKRLCEDSIWKRIDSFWAVGFGEQALNGNLIGMAQWMVKGYVSKWNFRNPKDYGELVDNYEEIARES